MFIQVDLNIGAERYFPDGPFRQAEARRSVKMLHIPRGVEGIALDEAVPDFLVTDSMVARYLEIRPPRFRVTTHFDLIISEIERAYVLGQFFAAVAASVVSIERMLNDARVRLHEHASPNLKHLWGKGPLNEWGGNIDALQKWGYIQPSLADELRGIFDIRCQYLHSAAINTPEQDARRCVVAAFAVLTEFVGFPERLFRIGSAIECLDTSHRLFEVFYKPALSEAAVPGPYQRPANIQLEPARPTPRAIMSPRRAAQLEALDCARSNEMYRALQKLLWLLTPRPTVSIGQSNRTELAEDSLDMPPYGQVLVLSCRGAHVTPRPNAVFDKLGKYADGRMPFAGILIDLGETNYTFSSADLGSVAAAIAAWVRGSVAPCAIVLTERSATNLQKVLELTKLDNLNQLRIVDTVESAQTHIRRQLERRAV